MKDGQARFMSRGMARTAPARSISSASVRADRAWPTTMITSPSAVTPTPERATYILLWSVAPHLESLSMSGTTRPPSTIRSRHWRTPTTSGVIRRSRPQTPMRIEPSR